MNKDLEMDERTEGDVDHLPYKSTFQNRNQLSASEQLVKKSLK
jgi:hypothetical protein